VPGVKIFTELPAKRTYVTARKVGHSQEFTLKDTGETSFVATKGSWFVSLFVGTFKPYCEFKVSVVDHEGKFCEITLERNGHKVEAKDSAIKQRAKEFVNSIIAGILGAGGKVLKEKEF